jgi:hypothetical protein
MRDALTDIKVLTAGGKQAFETDRGAQQAVAYNLAVLGEAARALSPRQHGHDPILAAAAAELGRPRSSRSVRTTVRRAACLCLLLEGLHILLGADLALEQTVVAL